MWLYEKQKSNDVDVIFGAEDILHVVTFDFASYFKQ